MAVVGSRIGRIRVESVLGRGGMGDVYVGHDETLQRQVALKSIRREVPDASGGARETRTRFRRPVGPAAAALLLLAFLPSCHGASPGQPGSLAPELIEKIRAGGALASDPSADYTLELEGPDVLPLVPVILNGRGPFPLLVDFGANVVVLRPDTAEQAGIEVLVEREGTDIGRAETMEIAGQLEYTDVHVGIDDGLRDVAGVVGFNVLRFASSRWDGPGRRLEISPAIGVEADAEGSLPLKIESRMPYLLVRSGETELWANLDTGAGEWFTIPAADREAFSWRDVREGPVTYNNQTGEQRVESAVFVPGLDVGTETLSGFPVYINPDADTPWFGMSLLRHCVTTLDLQAERALLECELPAALPPGQPPG